MPFESLLQRVQILWYVEPPRDESEDTRLTCSGTTDEFCKGAKVTSPECGGRSSDAKTIGYYEGWNLHQQTCGSESGALRMNHLVGR